MHNHLGLVAGTMGALSLAWAFLVGIEAWEDQVI